MNRKRRILQTLVTLAHAGEKYFAITPKDYLRTLAAGAGAGLITAFTVLAKAYLSDHLQAGLLQSTLIFVNYAGSFLMMQAVGFRLATKQPSLLAAALIRKAGGKGHPLHRALTTIRAICRAQFAATAGNFTAVLATAFLVDRVVVSLTGSHPISDHEARLAFKTIDILSVKMLAAAALTGVILWLASMCGAWLARRPRSASRALRSRYSGAGCSVSLGALLAYVPFLGKLSGFPLLNVCHFTLSSGWLAFAVLNLGTHEAMGLGLARAATGIAVVGALNFGMAFLSSLLSLAAAHPERVQPLKRVLGPAARAFARAPGTFLLPVLVTAEPTEA